MSKRRKKNNHLTELSVPNALVALVGYFRGHTCRKCAFLAMEYLIAQLNDDEVEVRLSGRVTTIATPPASPSGSPAAPVPHTGAAVVKTDVF
jgi:hypothetical protein